MLCQAILAMFVDLYLVHVEALIVYGTKMLQGIKIHYVPDTLSIVRLMRLSSLQYHLMILE